MLRMPRLSCFTSACTSRGTWREAEFKDYNFAALGLPPAGGALHPLLKVRSAYRRIFTSMGFEEMPTNNYVESSFWNFDALFQPQQVRLCACVCGGGGVVAAAAGVGGRVAVRVVVGRGTWRGG